MEIVSDITTLDNGLRVLTSRIPTAQAASVSFFVKIGSRGEDTRTNGLSHYLEHMLFKGTQKRPSAPQISEAIEGAGGQLNAYTSHEITCYWNNLPFESLETGIDVIADTIQNSLLDEEEITRERTVVQQELRRSHDNPSAWVSELMGKALFGDQAVGWPIGGTIETVEALERPDFIEHMNTNYRTHSSVLAISGNIEHQKVIELASKHFVSLGDGQAPPAPAAATAGLPEEHILVEERQIEQTNIVLSMQAFGRRDPDRYALEIMNAILGRGMSSRLFKEVRERRGLAYSISSGSHLLSDIGTLAINAGVTREHQEESLEVIVAELHRLVAEPVVDEELQRAIDFIAGGVRLSQETARAVGQRNGNQLIMDGELESIEETVVALRAVTATDVQRVAKRIIGTDRLALAVVGPSASVDRLDTILSR